MQLKVHANSSTCVETSDNNHAHNGDLDKLLQNMSIQLTAGREAVLFAGGIIALFFLVSVLSYSQTLCTLIYLGFAALCLPYRVVSFMSRKWTFFLVDFCYFANLACAAFLLFRPEDRRLEAAVYALCEGPLAAALIAWQCACVLGSPDHVISVLIHLLPGLAMYCHRYLAFSRRPTELASQIGLALLGKAEPVADRVASHSGVHAGGWGLALWGQHLATAAAIARGRVPCPTAFAAKAIAADATATAAGLTGAASVCDAATAGVDSASGAAAAGLVGTSLVGVGSAFRLSPGGVDCYMRGPAGPPPPCPSPAWLWLGVVPIAFYLAWQLLYFLIVQVAFRRMILAGGYDTSYRALARRAQRANSPLNQLVRSGGVARRLLMYGLLQLLFTVATQAFAVATYYSFVAATAWQVVKLLVPLYLGACHQCQRQPVQQLRAAAARLVIAAAASGALPAPAPPSGMAAAGRGGKQSQQVAQAAARVEGCGCSAGSYAVEARAGGRRPGAVPRYQRPSDRGPKR